MMLSTLTLPLLAGFLLLLFGMRKRGGRFELDYGSVRLDLRVFLIAYGLAFVVALLPLTPVRYAAALGLVLIYVWYVTIHLNRGEVSEVALRPLFLSRRQGDPSNTLIVFQTAIGLGLMIGGAHTFVHVVNDAALSLGVSPLVLALLVAPIATELPETMNSFMWVYQKKDTLAIGNITGAMVFQGTIPVTTGLIGTNWKLDTASMIGLTLPLFAVALFFTQTQLTGRWEPRVLMLPIFLYAGYMAYVFLR
jgi:cation:H+ antiporter